MKEVVAMCIVALATTGGFAINRTMLEQQGFTLDADLNREVIGRLRSIEVEEGLFIDGSKIALDDGTQIQVKGTYPVYTPGASVVKTYISGKSGFCINELCRYQQD